MLSISNCKRNTDNQHLQDKCLCNYVPIPHLHYILSTVKLGNKERFDKEQIGIKEPFPVTNLPFTS